MRLPAGASADDIETRFKFLAHRYHPDHNEGTPDANEKFRELLDARNFLKNNYRAGQVWARTKNGLEWEWNRPSYREPRREAKASRDVPPPPPPRPAHVRTEQNRSWEKITPPKESVKPQAAPKAPKKARFNGLRAKAASAYAATASYRPDYGYLIATCCVLLAIYAIYWKTAPKVRTVGDFGKKIQTPAQPAKPKAPAQRTGDRLMKDLARDTIAKNWGSVASCLGAIPKNRYYRGTVTYRVKIERQLANEVAILNDSLGYTLAHKCVTRAIFAMDFGRVTKPTTVDFSGLFELGNPRVAGR